jgi:hypothetical protein
MQGFRLRIVRHLRQDGSVVAVGEDAPAKL